MSSLPRAPRGRTAPPGDKVVIYTDGACSGNPGPGAWAALLRYRGRERELSGFEPETTNQRMELRAAVEALTALKRPCRVDLYSDSAYLVNAFRLGWVDRWERNGWRNSRKEPVENQDLWRELLALVRRHDVTFHKVTGHADDEDNNRVDALARRRLQESAGQASDGARPNPSPSEVNLRFPRREP